MIIERKYLKLIVIQREGVYVPVIETNIEDKTVLVEIFKKVIDEIK